MKNWKKFLPSKEQLSQEVIATLIGIIVSAWIISRIPELKQLVKDSNT